MKASQKCGFSVVVHPEGVVISVRYAPCLKKKVLYYFITFLNKWQCNSLVSLH